MKIGIWVISYRHTVCVLILCNQFKMLLWADYSFHLIDIFELNFSYMVIDGNKKSAEGLIF